jgi:hypothetical protein
LVRALVVPVLVLLGVTGYLVTSAALAANTTVHRLEADRPPVTSAWKAGYSRQYPGCVASVLWPERETPVAIVLRWRSGEVARVAMRHVRAGVFTQVRTGQADIIGACYRR